MDFWHISFGSVAAFFFFSLQHCPLPSLSLGVIISVG